MPKHDDKDDADKQAEKPNDNPAARSNPLSNIFTVGLDNDPPADHEDDKTEKKPAAAKKSKADAEDEPAAAEEAPAKPAAQRPIIEDLLKDRSFDPDNKVRPQLAEISATQGVGKRAPADLVSADGKPVEQPA